MRPKKKPEATLPVIHDPLWRDKARGAGWTDDEISSLDSILRLSREDERVVQIKNYDITILTTGKRRFDGIGVMGPNTSTIEYRKYWTWRRFPMPASIVGGISEPAEVHETRERIISFDLCGCDILRRKKHHPSCSLGTGETQQMSSGQIAPELPDSSDAVDRRKKQPKGANPNQLPMFDSAGRK